jgi:Carbohydrate family 9 binding domain-like/Secretion system C-terminal sorting domain
MKKLKIKNLIAAICLFLANTLNAQIGFFDAPYDRYEAELGTLVGSAAVTTKSYDQSLVQSEASDQQCVTLSAANASVSWTVIKAGDGLVVRYSIPDGTSGNLDVYNGASLVGTLNLTTTWSWEMLMGNPNPNDAGVTNPNWKMRFDEVRMKLPAQIPAGGTLKLVWQTSGVTLNLDFAELEPVPPAVTAGVGDITYTSGSLQSWIDSNPNKTLFLPPGVYNVGNSLSFTSTNTLKGAGSWYTEIHFTSGTANNGGLWGYANNVSYSGLYLTTSNASRSNNYKAINGAYTSGSTIKDIWAIHFECGAWIANYNTIGPQWADGFTMSYCRFRNNYADGTNLCGGTQNAVVEHCSYRNNGDDDMAIWPATGLSRGDRECSNNTFRYNTAENSWRASSCAVYGGLSNIFHDILIKDNLEAGLRANNNFGGYPFNTGGQHQFYNIKIISGGTYHDLFNSRVGAIDLTVSNIAGNIIYNVKFSCIEIVDAKNDAIYINKTNGSGYSGLIFENITINGTGAEYPNNGGSVAGRGYMVLFNNSPGGSASYCGMSYGNRGGSATVDVSGTFSWNAAGSCPSGCLPLSTGTSSTTITSATTFGACDNPITLTATSTPPSGKTVSSVQFYVDGVSKGTDNSSPYSVSWSSPSVGTHSVYAVSTYSDASTSTSPTQTVTITDEIYSTSSAPVIDGSIDVPWNGSPSFSISNVSVGAANISGAADLSATFKILRDATNLYILADVNDNSLFNDGGNSYDNDQIEFFIDMGNTKATSYGANDFSYNYMWNSAAIGGTNTTGVTFAQTTKAGNLGYIMEVKIPWTTLGGAPAAGSFMGFDMGVDDDDDGGARDSKIDWSDATDNAWHNPSVFGTLQIANCASPLPVNLLTFTGEKENETVVLKWATTSENSNEKFIVERSNNLSDWQAIGEVAGAGNSVAVIDYSFTDYDPPGEKAYYRLKQVDLNGMFTISNVVVVQGTKQSVSIMPNPFDDAITIRSNLSGNMDIRIHDILGRLVYHLNQKTDDGMLLIQPDLPGGAYLISIQTADFVEHRKIIKK